ncbi:MAG TPA: TetR/AcrR family transcriptional regulator [Candidatus Limnocylindria bacterium]
MSVGTKEQQILTAGRQLFLRHGYEGATTDALVDKARVSKETLYRYYPTKDALLTAVIKDMAARRRAIASDLALPADATRRTLETLLRRLTEAALAETMRPEYLDLLRLVIGESARRPHLAKLLREMLTGGGAVRRLLRSARDQGLLRQDVKTDVAAQILGGAVLGWVLDQGVLAGPRADPPTPFDVDEIVRLFLRGISS